MAHHGGLLDLSRQLFTIWLGLPVKSMAAKATVVTLSDALHDQRIIPQLSIKSPGYERSPSRLPFQGELARSA